MTVLFDFHGQSVASFVKKREILCYFGKQSASRRLVLYFSFWKWIEKCRKSWTWTTSHVNSTNKLFPQPAVFDYRRGPLVVQWQWIIWIAFRSLLFGNKSSWLLLTVNGIVSGQINISLLFFFISLLIELGNKKQGQYFSIFPTDTTLRQGKDKI